MRPLTKPQADLLFSLMRNEREPDGAEWRVAGNLRAKGFVETAGRSQTFRPTRAGLEALAYYWMLKDARSGCIAWAKYRQEVDAALAARFPEPLPLAA